MVDPTQTEGLPVIVGLVLTVTGVTTKQPKLLVYVMFVVPDDTAVTKPLVEFTVAVAVLLDTHEPAVGEPVN
jgi:hypothetical protein